MRTVTPTHSHSHRGSNHLHVPVLLVEPSEDEALLVGRCFQELGASKYLHWVKDGNEATLYLSGKGKYADRHRHPLPALILLELKVPVRDGFEVLRWIRGYKSFARIPIVVFTDCFDDRIVRRAYELGANSFLNKPEDLTARRKMLNEVRTYWTSYNIVEGSAKMDHDHGHSHHHAHQSHHSHHSHQTHHSDHSHSRPHPRMRLTRHDH